MGTDLKSVADVAAYLAQRVEVPAADLHAELLSGGNMNRVWRVRAHASRGGFASLVGPLMDSSAAQTMIVKHAPPYVAKRPDIPMDPGRLRFEARALDLLHSPAAFGLPGFSDRDANSIESPRVKVPRLYAYDPDRAVILMEDLGAARDLGQAIADSSGAAADLVAIGSALGQWLAGLHGMAAQDAARNGAGTGTGANAAGVFRASDFQNASVQATRARIQYRGAAESLRRAGVTDAAALGERAADFGQRLLEPGVCLTMGDLWPASVLLSGDHCRSIALIDWEFAHYGRPVQDVAHLAAHLFMRIVAAPDAGTRERAQATGRGFVESYLSAVGEAREDSDFNADSALHFACEILMRTAGPFQAGYLFENQTRGDDAYAAAVAAAVDALRDPNWQLSRLFV